MKKNRRIHVGTSGWHYAHWKGPFYPDDLRSGDFLAYYSKRFDTVEINNTFYRLPEKKTLIAWRECTPPGFVFSAKASRYITHMKKLKDPGKPLKAYLQRIKALGDKLGPILLQLPPRWSVNPERLESFLRRVPAGVRCAFEFRDPSWFDSRVYGLLRDHGAAFCVYDFDGLLSPSEVTADFVYVRLHGPGPRYQGEYEVEELCRWASAISTWAKKGKEVFCYFDNDQAGYAASDALKLRSLLDRS